MFSRSFVALALGALALGRSIPLTRRDGQATQPAHWWSGLELYATYHARYMALSCETQHGKPFFDQCCHPRLKDADPSSFPAECTPDDGDDDCDDDDGGSDPTPSAPAQTPAPKPTPAPAPKPTTTQTTHHTTATSSPNPIDVLISGSGHGTWYSQNGNAGACGQYHSDSFKVVAIDSAIYGGGKYCGKTIEITNTDNGKTTTALVGDECPTCDSSKSVDLSQATFQALESDLGVGEINISWKIVNSN